MIENIAFKQNKLQKTIKHFIYLMINDEKMIDTKCPFNFILKYGTIYVKSYIQQEYCFSNFHIVSVYINNKSFLVIIKKFKSFYQSHIN